MKKTIILFLTIFCLALSCKKENTNFSQFSVGFANLEDSIYYDSVSYAIINYSDMAEFKDTTTFRNPDIYSHSEKVDKRFPLNIDTYGITVKSGHTYVIKKFELISKSGNVIFYIPNGLQYFTRNGIKRSGPNFPFVFKAFSGGMSGGLYVVRKV
jgi:hypothetical protein